MVLVEQLGGGNMAAATSMRRVLCVLFLAFKGRYCGKTLHANEVDCNFYCRNSRLPLCGRFL
jgi:hypothetical protein